MSPPEVALAVAGSQRQNPLTTLARFYHRTLLVRPVGLVVILLIDKFFNHTFQVGMEITATLCGSPVAVCKNSCRNQDF